MKSFLIACLIFISFTPRSADAADPLIKVYKMELEAQSAPEGSLLVEQKYKGQSAYTLSYYVGAKTLRTQVLLKSVFDTYALQMKTAMPAVETWERSQLLQCSSSATYASKVSGQKKSKRICFDALSDRSKAKFSETYARLKDVALGRGI